MLSCIVFDENFSILTKHSDYADHLMFKLTEAGVDFPRFVHTPAAGSLRNFVPSQNWGSFYTCF